MYVYENIVQALKHSHEHMILSTKVKVGVHWDMLGRITYFNSTQFTVYNGVTHDLRN